MEDTKSKFIEKLKAFGSYLVLQIFVIILFFAAVYFIVMGSIYVMALLSN